MKWVVVAIIACIVPYTWLTLAYRKENPAHQPYQDNKDRAQVLRLLNSGFHRFEAELDLLSAAPPHPPQTAEVAIIDGGVPPLLHELLIDSPVLPAHLSGVVAPPTGKTGTPYAVTFVGPRPGTDDRPATATVYHREQELVFIVSQEDEAIDPSPAQPDSFVRLTISAHQLTHGTYHATLVGADQSLRWTLEIR